jgi:hypothetical protein
MKLSQAVDLYIQRKRDAGMRFDSPTNILRSFLRRSAASLSRNQDTGQSGISTKTRSMRCSPPLTVPDGSDQGITPYCCSCTTLGPEPTKWPN